ncbi:MAG TPA: choice-of-anchor tandem repeat NxxGxxAF-containing protein [bacterium]|nr:choice-of-anchor tandem repeat NxxGxxAF-containing protein [bacterium]
MRPRSPRLRTAGLMLLFAAFVAVPALALRSGTPAARPWSVAAAAPPPAAGAPRPAAAIRLLVRTGDHAPDGGTFTVLADPALNDRGDIAFGGQTSAREAAQALYLRRDGRITTLVAAGRRVSTGGAFSSFSDAVLNNRGTVIFLGRTTDRAARLGIYTARNGAVVPVVATGQPAPSGGVFTDFANPTINDHDVIAFVGRTNGTGQEGIFTNIEGATTIAVMGGWPAPTGGLFQFFLDGSPALNDRGQIAFVAATTEHSTQGVYVLSEGRIASIVTTDDTAPVGGPFTEFGFVTVTDAGTVGFVGRTARSAVREALYTTGRAVLVTLARQGETAEDRVPFPTFTNVVMNGAEDVVFEPGIVRFPDVYPHVIYLARRSGVAVVVRAGEAAPGGGRFTAFSQPVINGPGGIAFVAETDDGRHGIYLVTRR